MFYAHQEQHCFNTSDLYRFSPTVLLPLCTKIGSHQTLIGDDSGTLTSQIDDLPIYLQGSVWTKLLTASTSLIMLSLSWTMVLVS